MRKFFVDACRKFKVDKEGLDSFLGEAGKAMGIDKEEGKKLMGDVM